MAEVLYHAKDLNALALQLCARVQLHYGNALALRSRANRSTYFAQVRMLLQV